MQQFGDIQIDFDKVITPHGHIPFNPDSTVRAVYIRSHKYAKRVAGAGFFAAAVATGGAGILFFAPSMGFLFHQSHRVILNTDGRDFLVKKFGAILGDARADALDLQRAISNAIENLRDDEA